MSRSTSPRDRQRAAIEIGTLERQENRTHYRVYAHVGTRRHDGFLDALFARVPARGMTRGALRDLVGRLDPSGAYRVRYNSLIYEPRRAGEPSVARRLF